MGKARRNQKLIDASGNEATSSNEVIKTDWKTLFTQLVQASQERNRAWTDVNEALVRKPEA